MTGTRYKNPVLTFSCILYNAILREISKQLYVFAFYWVFVYSTPDDGRITETCSVRIISEFMLS
jgi:hypothetical protein